MMGRVLDAAASPLGCALFACIVQSGVLVACTRDLVPTPPMAAPVAPTEPPSSTPLLPPTELACLPNTALRSPLAHVETENGKIIACWVVGGVHPQVGETYPCVGIAPDGTTLTVASKRKAPPSDRHPSTSMPTTSDRWDVRAKGKAIEICPRGTKSCRSVTVGSALPAGIGHGGAQGDAPIAAVTEDGKKLFLVAVEIPKGKALDTTNVRAFGETWEVDAGKRLSRVPLMNAGNAKLHVLADHTDLWQAAWVGDRVMLTGRRCCGPAAGVELLDPISGDATQLGDPVFFVRVSDDRWLLGSERSGGTAQLTVLDVKTAKSVATFDVPVRPFDEPELYAMDATVRVNGTAVVVYGNPPGVVVVDVDKPSMSPPRPIPVCAP